MGVLASDNFTRANENPLASPWVSVSPFADLKLDTNQVQVITASVDSWMYRSGPTWPNDQYSKVTISVLGGKDAGPVVRGNSSGDGYFVNNTSAGLYSLYKTTASGTSFNKLVDIAGTDLVAGDILELQATGAGTTLLTVKVNGATIGTQNDSSSPHLSGSAGMYAYDGTVRITAFEGGNFVSNTSMVADAGSFTLAGIAAILKRGRGYLKRGMSIGWP